MKKNFKGTKNETAYYSSLKAAFKGNDVEEISRQICIIKNERNFFDSLEGRLFSVDEGKENLPEALAKCFKESGLDRIAWDTLRDGLLTMVYSRKCFYDATLKEWVTALRENRAPEFIPDRM